MLGVIKERKLVVYSRGFLTRRERVNNERNRTRYKRQSKCQKCEVQLLKKDAIMKGDMTSKASVISDFPAMHQPLLI